MEQPTIKNTPDFSNEEIVQPTSKINLEKKISEVQTEPIVVQDRMSDIEDLIMNNSSDISKLMNDVIELSSKFNSSTVFTSSKFQQLEEEISNLKDVVTKNNETILQQQEYIVKLEERIKSLEERKSEVKENKEDEVYSFTSTFEDPTQENKNNIGFKIF